MVIVYLYDNLNGFRYRRFSLDYYERVKGSSQIVSAWAVGHV